MSSQEESQAGVPVEASIKPSSPIAYGNCTVNQTDHIANDNYSQCSSCQEFTTLFPFSYNIFIPATDSSIHQFMKLRHKLTTTYLRCRLRMGVNTFDSGCIYGNERLLRVESQTEEELIQAIDRLDEVIPAWKVWQRGKVDSQLIR
ncbi:hypothetical protein ECG_06606 [Echinococcus granulosus]|uniref:Uncharacterized protein n=1 Tax=Echinococcus granulosus TaxID=6210 RepID=U6JA61_ECHGR|nr:hypothetical protein EGR_04783 [Echinococcus granulosus]EUB60401.1 hypothetical protein EGR_04783 [Echinococcus granulosus]KAH9280382.1 hypothetical protein ECG_06606 [Echinococcus granulosus]CDS19304.1 hypothetical protein EgrG_000459900 [Echinococcus granulosus]